MSKPFTIWTRGVKVRRFPLNTYSLVVVLSVTDCMHDAGWVGIQDFDGELFSMEIEHRSPDYKGAKPRGYIVT